MRLRPSGRSRNPGNVATAASGRGLASPLVRPRFFAFLVSGAAGVLPPRDTESAEPGMANLAAGAGGGVGWALWAESGEDTPRPTRRPVNAKRRRTENGIT